ncbi:MAG TPA: MBG domain-containing protein, partial [Bacteroidia bacterium]|nr:MBG domain-containing protein [Bacteroidia bacterium]
GTHNFTLNSCKITTSTYGVYMQQADTLVSNNCDINGNNSPGTIGYYIALAPGNITINGGAIRNCTCAVKAYNTNTNAVVDNIVGTDVNLSGTVSQFCSFFTNGAHYGSNVRFITGFFTFGPIAGVIYGVANLDPGATSNLAITYTTTGHHTTIVSGLIHVLSAGTDTITATTADTSAARSVVISKKAVVITCNNLVKSQGTVNPALTFGYSSLAYGETNSVWSSQPTLSTSCITSSPVGTYAITASGAASPNYSFSYVPGTLTVITGSSKKIRFGAKVH